MLQDLAELATAGELIPLTRVQTPVAPVFISESVEVEEIETVTVASQSWSLDETDEVDDSTKPIPTQRDDLF
jgi:hypothetical protein